MREKGTMMAYEITMQQNAKGKGWVEGTIGNYRFEARVLARASAKGIDRGRITQLLIWDERMKTAKCPYNLMIAFYDEGWHTCPMGHDRPAYIALVDYLYNR